MLLPGETVQGAESVAGTGEQRTDQGHDLHGGFWASEGGSRGRGGLILGMRAGEGKRISGRIEPAESRAKLPHTRWMVMGFLFTDRGSAASR